MTRTNQPPRGANRPVQPPPPPKFPDPLRASTSNHLAPGTAFSVINSRAPQALDPSSASLNCLGYDIILLIVELIWHVSPKSLLSLAHVSSFYHDVARYCQHREVALNLSHPKKDDQNVDLAIAKMKYLEEAGLLPAIRHLTIQGWRPDSVPMDLENPFPKMTALSDVSWEFLKSSMGLLQALRERPHVRLHVQRTVDTRFLRSFSKHLAKLENNLNLTSLHLELTYVDAEECLKITQPLKRVLLTCPNIRNLKLDLSLPRGGCCAYSPPHQYCGMGFLAGERPPALEELQIIAYPFGWGENEATQPFPQPGYPLRGREEEYWADNFDWSRLGRLVIHNTDLAMRMLPKLTSLQEVVFTSLPEQTRIFYQHVPVALESITVTTIGDIGVDTLLRHGSKLRTLRIHQTETFYKDSWRSAAPDDETLRRIREGCPNLEELEVDIGRDGFWPYSTLNILAGFPKLKTLTIWFELGVGFGFEVRRPTVTATEAQGFFKYLRETCPLKQSSPLRKLVIHSGAIGPLGTGYPAAEALWRGSRKMSFTCTLSERDDEACKGRYTLECSGLNARENKYLQDLVELQGKNYDKYEGVLSNDLKLARDGPMPGHEWGFPQNLPYDRYDTDL